MAAINNPTPVQSPITPGSDDHNTWATHYAKYGAGGFIMVENDTERDAITPERLVDKMVYNKATSKFNHHNGTTWVETSLGNATVPQTTLDDIKKNADDIQRLKTNISAQPTEIYTYRGSVIPDVPNEARKAYYISLFTITDATKHLQLPSVNLANGAIFCVDNEDVNDNAFIDVPSGASIDGNPLITGINVTANSLLILVKVTSGWETAVSGIIPKSLSTLITQIKAKLPVVAPLSIQEIEAQLKDRLHTFREIQTEFSNQLHTEYELQNDGFLASVFWAGYKTTSDAPTNLNWAKKTINAQAANTINIPSNDQHIMFAVHEAMFPLIKKLKINNIDVKYIVFDLIDNQISYKVIMTDTPYNAGDYNIDFEFGINVPTGGDTGIGIQGDDAQVNLGITDLTFPTSIVSIDQNIPTTAFVQPYINVNFPLEQVPGEEPQPAQEFKSTSVQFLPPLQGFSDPNKVLGTIVELEHNKFELLQSPGMLAYLSEDTEVVGDLSDAKKHHNGALWLGDFVVPAGAYITTNITKKTYGIQDWTEDDPNITGGVNYLIAFRAAFKGNAPADGLVKIAIIKDGTTPLDTGVGYVEDVNGKPLLVERYYKSGQKLGVLDIIAVVNAKGLQEFKCIVVDNFTSESLVLEDRTEGATGLLIQCIKSSKTNEAKTGTALQQFEIDTNQNIEFSSYYLGKDRLTIDYVVKESIPLADVPAGRGQTLTDGLHFYNRTAIKVGIVDGHFTFQDNGTDVCDFCFGKIFSAEETKMLRNKIVTSTTTIIDKNSGWKVALMKWTGKPDQYTKQIFTSRNNSEPVFQTGWTKADELFITQDVVSGDHTVSKDFTIPIDANNYAIIIYPVEATQPKTLKLKKFNVDVKAPFTGYVIEAPELLSQSIMYNSNRFKHLVQDTQGYDALRYTITNSPTPMPVGVLKEGNADIKLDPTINVISGSAAKGGEGAIVFNAQGTVKINTKIRISNEKALPYNNRFWYSTVNPNNVTFVKIANSEHVMDVPANTQNLELDLPEFSINVNPGDKIVLFAQSDIADGGYIICTDNSKPMIDTKIEFQEVTATSDNPGTVYVDNFDTTQFDVDVDNNISLKTSIDGLDTSWATTIFKQKIAVMKEVMLDANGDFTMNNFIIPDGVIMSVKAYWVTNENIVMQLIERHEYNPALHTFTLNSSSANRIAKILFTFYK